MNFYNNKQTKKGRKSYWEKQRERVAAGEITEDDFSGLITKHKLELEKRRKYTYGEPIKNIAELFYRLRTDKLVWMYGRPMTAAFVYSQQLMTIIHNLNNGNILRVVKKQEIIQ